jgi:hypothetical protein
MIGPAAPTPTPRSSAPAGTAASAWRTASSTDAASSSDVRMAPVGCRKRVPGRITPSDDTSPASTFVPPRSIARASSCTLRVAAVVIRTAYPELATLPN